ncbi:MAG: hypothetical protein SF052_22445 [Bacteroidia bacterium]|nr:hypothetical protein [Bacteroidia bacterium]
MSVKAQEIQNPSFEGPRGPSVIPWGWEPCGQGSTPDTQPGSWYVNTPPSGGESYLSMICRGKGVPYPDKWETCQQRLEQPLEAGGCYRYSIDLARSGSFSSGTIYFTGPASLHVWGGIEACSRDELLWDSGEVSQTEWLTYEFTIAPEKNSYNYLIVEAYYSQLPTYSGNILIDNFFLLGPCEPMASR